MRSDSTLPSSDFRASPQWRIDPFTQEQRAQLDQRYEKGSEESATGTQWHSFSGHERNCFFQNVNGQQFVDQSSLSGLDQIADSRAFVIWDFDRDGQSDLGLVNADYPLLNLYRNQVADRKRNSTHNSFVALRFTGSNFTSEPQSGSSTRDAYGARVRVKTRDLTLLREHRCGEGFAAQNSATLLIGLGSASSIEELSVHWPSGKTETWRDLPVRKLIQLYESADRSPGGKTLELIDYQPARLAWNDAEPDSFRATRGSYSSLPMNELLPPDVAADRRLYLLTTMATWCEACHRHHPHLKRLADRYANSVTLLGIPVDPIETPEELDAHALQWNVPYQILSHIRPELRDTITQVIRREYDSEAIPSSVLVDQRGQVLQIFLGTPTASDLGRWLMKTKSMDSAPTE